ncbi:hypothetical protein [Spirosoma areae]
MTHFPICATKRWHIALLVVWMQIPAPLFAQLRYPSSGKGATPSSLRQGDGLQTIENSQIRVGINTNYGGAITYLAFLNNQGGKVTTSNMVNNPDLGRQIQIALYSGPADYSKNGDPGWAGLGWNPIQAGDTYRNPSEVVTFKKESNLLYVKTIPKQFAINNEPGQATIEHWIRLEGNVVKVHARIALFRSDKTQYEARQQEFPCMYLNGDYHNMWYYSDRSPYTKGNLTQSRIQPPATTIFGDVLPTEPWMASTNDNGYGVGLYVPGNYEWKRGYFGADLGGDENSVVASYVAATNRVILDHNIVHEWDYELIVGHLDGIRSYVYAQPRSSPGPNFRFDTSRKGWYYQKAHDTGWPIAGKLHVNLFDPGGNNSRITSPHVFWKGRSNPFLYLRAAFQTQHNKFRLKWRRSEDVTIYGTADRYADFPIINDGQFHTYKIDLSGDDDWLEQNIGQLEFSTIPDGPAINGWTEFEWLATSDKGPGDEPSTPIVEVPKDPVVEVPCEPGCEPIRSKKTRYIVSNRKR